MITNSSPDQKYNIVLTGVNFLGHMASPMRVKNLLGPLLRRRLIRLHNLIIVGGKEVQPEYADPLKDVEIYVNSYNISNPLSLIRYFYLGITYLRDMRDRTCKNILYIYSYPFWENILFIVVARCYGYRIIFDIVEDYRFPDSYSSWRGKIKNAISLFFFRRLGRLAHGCIAISQHLFDLCRKMTDGNIPVELIPGSIDLEDFPRLSVPTDNSQEFIFFYGGNFAEKDGIDLMIRAFEPLASGNSQIKLVLTGEGADRHMRTLFHLIETSPAKRQIEYLGYVSRDQYLAQLGRADVLLVLRVNSPFANAGFPFKVSEYLASGRPVIASKVRGVGNYLTHKDNAILVEPGDIEQISAAMLYCLTHKSEVTEIGKNGRLAAEQWFDANTHSMRVLSFFERL